MKVLNLYAGIGGNRKLWDGVDVTAVEINSEIAGIYQDFFPDDTVVIGDAHKYLVDHYGDFDFIWSSPPCPTHSHIRKELAVEARGQNNPVYPDMDLYEEIIFLQGYAKCKYVVENVISWYKPLIKPQISGHHYFWSNFFISNDVNNKYRGHHENINNLCLLKGFDLSFYNGIDKRKVLRNCVHPLLGKHIFDCAFRVKQEKLEVSLC